MLRRRDRRKVLISLKWVKILTVWHGQLELVGEVSPPSGPPSQHRYVQHRTRSVPPRPAFAVGGIVFVHGQDVYPDFGG